MLFSLRGDVPDPLVGLEIGDELSSDGHLPTMRQPEDDASWNLAATDS
jgi:hypothetical protein